MRHFVDWATSRGPILVTVAVVLAATVAHPSGAAPARTLAGVEDGVTARGEAREPKLIRLRTRTFDPLTPEGQASRPQSPLRALRGTAYLVQFAALPLDSQRAELRLLGVRIGAYIPDATYVVRMSPLTRKTVQRLPFVRWVGRYDAGDKIVGGLLPTTTRRYIVTLVERDAADQRAVVTRIEAAGGTVHVVSASRRLIEATLSPAQVLTVAHLDEVLAIDFWSAPEPDLDNARAAGGADALETARGYRGQGVRGEVFDAGLRTTHQEFAASPPIIHVGNTTNVTHGTSTYGEIFASGVSANARGLLPRGRASSPPTRW